MPKKKWGGCANCSIGRLHCETKGFRNGGRGFRLCSDLSGVRGFHIPAGLICHIWLPGGGTGNKGFCLNLLNQPADSTALQRINLANPPMGVPAY